MTEATTEALPVPATSPMVPSSSFSDVISLRTIRNLPARLDDGMITQLQAVIDMPMPEKVPVSSDYVNKALLAMMAVLPRQGKDSTTGALMVDQYCRKLGQYPKGAIDHLWRESVDRLKWFPTVAECKEIIAEWVSQSDMLGHAKSIAASRINRERDFRFRDAMDALKAGTMPQEQVDALPEPWCKMAVEQGYLWNLKDGTYRPRPNTWGMTPEQLEAHRAIVDQLRAEGLL